MYLNEDLNYLIDSEIINIPNIQSIIKMIKRQELLNNHPYKIWEGNNGKWYTYLPDDNKGRILKKRNTKKDIEDVVIIYWDEIINSPTIEEIFHEWNDYRLSLNKIAKSSHTRFEQVYKRHYSSFGKKRIKDITEDEYVEFLERQVFEHHLTSKSFASLKTITKGIIKRAKRKKIITWNYEDVLFDVDISRNEFKKTIKKDCDEVFDEDEMPIIINYLKEHLDIRNTAVLLMFITGMRIGEVAVLKPEDLNPIKNTISIRRIETRYKEDGKTYYDINPLPKTINGYREIIIPTHYRWLIRNLKTISDGHEFVFHENNKRLTTLLIRKRLYKICDEIKIDKKSPHKIRKTYDSILQDAHLDSRFIINQMGHSNIKTSEIYYHRDRKNYENKVAIMDSIKDFVV